MPTQAHRRNGILATHGAGTPHPTDGEEITVSPIRSLAYVVAVCSLVVIACATAPEEEHPVARMAVFDLNCPRAKVSFTRIAEDAVGATGCGRRIKYIRVCRLDIFDDECQWVAN